MLIDPKLAPFLNTEATKGIIRIYNMQTDKSLLIRSNNIIKDIKNIRFQLDLGLYNNVELQKDYAEIGLEVFALDPYKIINKDSKETLDELFEISKAELENNKVSFYK